MPIVFNTLLYSKPRSLWFSVEQLRKQRLWELGSRFVTVTANWVFFFLKYQLHQASTFKEVNLWSVYYFQMLQVTGKCVWKRVEKHQVEMLPLLFQERVIPSAVSLREWLLDVACVPMNVWRTSVKLSQVFPGRQEGKIWKHMCEAEIIKLWLIMQVRKS